MTRIMIGVSLGWMSMLVAASGCSSKSVDGDDEKGGTGAIIEGGTSASGGTTSGSGGSASGGTASGSGTNASGSGGSTAAGGGANACAGTPISCVDAETARACNPDTGMVETANCAEELAKEGLISNGCTMDEEGAGCTFDGLADQACADGAVAFGVCGELTESQILNVYINCFTDASGLNAIVTCAGEHVDEEAMMVDCEAAEACIPADFMP